MLSGAQRSRSMTTIVIRSSNNLLIHASKPYFPAT